MISDGRLLPPGGDRIRRLRPRCGQRLRAPPPPSAPGRCRRAGHGPGVRRAAARDRGRCERRIKEKVIEYGGRHHNPQIGGADAQGRVLTVLNSGSYDGPSGSLGEPCETGFADVKLTEKDSPPFFDLFGNHDYHGHARLQVLRLQSSDKLLPIAVEDPTPRAARAIFVDETTGATLAETPLKQNGSQDGLAIWDNSQAPVPVPITRRARGRPHRARRRVLHRLRRTTSSPATTPAPRTGDILHIQGWSAEGTVTQTPAERASGPAARPQRLARQGHLHRSLLLLRRRPPAPSGVRASVDFGADPAKVGAKLTANVGGRSYPMTYDPVTQTWSSGDVPVPATLRAAGRCPRVGGDQGQDRRQTCNGQESLRGHLRRPAARIQRDARPLRQIALAEVSESGVAWTNSLQRCSTVLPSCDHSLVVKIGVAGTLGLSDLGDPAGAAARRRSGSQTQSARLRSRPSTS